MAALTVPATLPGVVRVGTPLAGSCVAVSAVHEDDAGVLYCMVARDPMESHGAINPEPLCDLHVDLTDATGRAHVAWAVAAALGVNPSRCSPRWIGTTPRPGWAIDGGENYVYRRYYRSFDAFNGKLDPHDNTRLPDGSRWVDAEALRLVALHVLGGGK